MKRSFYPAWIPYPQCWLKAFGTALLLIPLASCISVGGGLGAMLSVVTINPLPLFLLGFVGLMLPFLAIAYLHNHFWGKRPNKWVSWLPAPNSIKAGLNALIILGMASLIAFFAILPFVDCYQPSYEPYCKNLTEEQTYWFAAIWLTAAAYLYQYDYLVRRHRANRRGRKSAPLSPFIDPIEVELDNLRRSQ